MCAETADDGSVDFDERADIGLSAQDLSRVAPGELGKKNELGAETRGESVPAVGDVGGDRGPKTKVVVQRGGQVRKGTVVRCSTGHAPRNLRKDM